MPSSDSKPHHRRRGGFRDMLQRLTGLNLNARAERAEREQQRRREQRRRERDLRHMQRYVTPHGHVSSARAIRRRVTEAQQRGVRVAPDVLYQLAALERILVTRPPSGRSSLRPGMLARLGQLNARWYFLGYDGFYYYSSHPLALGADFDITVDTFVPPSIRMVAYPYRQLCRS
ncbi:uncharacterized protein F4812DRAFT_466275 [Daldinia caldariorum]|uniref:uncharacterized protein n=1 Tax=Daldinia caldariorum TaxID=326644 RepID=UPI00200866F9|nr:uncharacterized protein F4812DRAFT_466275 [Daldinia caldariorum]KAI1465880.1 hypothetical protein F4812DRAFT_466275 [Daldinia caldariorum]